MSQNLRLTILSWQNNWFQFHAIYEFSKLLHQFILLVVVWFCCWSRSTVLSHVGSHNFTKVVDVSCICQSVKSSLCAHQLQCVQICHRCWNRLNNRKYACVKGKIYTSKKVNHERYNNYSWCVKYVLCHDSLFLHRNFITHLHLFLET